MTPAHCLVAVEIAAAVLISRRTSIDKHPALIAYLLAEPLATCLRPFLAAYPVLLLLQILIRAAVVLEIARLSRLPVSRETAARAVGLTLAAAAFLAACRPDLGTLERLMLTRQYYHLALAGAALAMLLWRAAYPVLETRRTRAYRVGIALWLGVIAMASTFVRGGIGYTLMPYTRDSWALLDRYVYSGLIAAVSWLALSMWASVAPRRKPAAPALMPLQVRRAA